MSETNIYGDVNTGGGSAHFDQRGQHVGNQVNVGRDLYVYNKGYARLNYDVKDLLDFYNQVFVGQETVIERIVDFAAQQKPGYLLIEAEAGHGKSALIARVVAQHQHGDWARPERPTLLYFFIRQSKSDDTPLRFLQAINSQLLKHLHVEGGVPADVDELRTQFSELWSSAVAQAYQEHPLLLLVDGLDESSETEQGSVATVLPASLSDYVHVVVTSRPNPEPQRQVDSPHPFRQAARLSLQTFGVDEVTALLNEYGWRGEDSTDLALRIHTLSKGVPLIARFVSQDVAEKGEEILAQLEKNPPEDVQAYYRQQFDALDQQTRSDLTWRILGIFTQSAGGISVVELAELLEQPTHRIRKALQPIQRYLLGRERVEIMDVELRRVLEKAFHPKELATYQEQLLVWGDRYKGDGWPQETPEYVLRHYGQHLMRDNRKADLYELVSKLWLEAHYRLLGSYSTFLQDVNRAWRVAYESGRAQGKQTLRNQAVAMQVKCLLAYSSIAALSNRLPPSLPMALFNDGLWTKPQVFAYIDHITERKQSVDARLALLQHENAQRLFAAIDIEFIVSAILDDLGLMERTTGVRVRSNQLFQLLPYLTTPQHRKKAIALAKTLDHTVWRPKLLARLIGQISDPAEQEQLIELLIKSCNQLDYYVHNDDYPHVTYIYREIVAHVPMTNLSRVCHRLMVQAEQQATSSDQEWRRLDIFFEHLAWHMSDAKAVAFITLLLSANYAVTSVAITIARLAYRLSDSSALSMATQFEETLKLVSPSQMRWYMGEISMAFLALACQRSDADCKNELLALAKRWLRQMDDFQYTLRTNDLSTLCSFIGGQYTDKEVSKMIKNGELFVNYWRLYNENNGWDVALLPYLGIQSIKALFTRAYGDDFIKVGASLYVIPLIATKLPPEELALIYRLGAGRHESFACAGYVQAAIQNYQRMSPDVKNDTIDWRIYTGAADVCGELLQIIAGDLREAHFDDDDYEMKRYLFAPVAPRLTNNLLQKAFTGASRSRFGSELEDQETLVTIAQQLPRAERRPIWEKMVKDTFRIIDRGEQKQLLAALKSAKLQTVVRKNSNLRKASYPSQSESVIEEQETNRWARLRETINTINNMADREKRIEAFRQVAPLLGDVVFVIGNSAYKVYLGKAYEIWSALNPQYIEDALSAIEQSQHPYQSDDYVRAFMPAVVLLRQDLLPELEGHINKRYENLKAIQYANLALCFTGEKRLALLQKSVDAFDIAEEREYIISHILTEIAGYADDMLLPHLLQWLERYPVAAALGKLAEKVAANQAYLTRCFAIAQNTDGSVHEFVIKLAPLVPIDWLRKLLLLLIEKQNKEEQRRTYPMLAHVWFTKLSNQDSYSEAYDLWYDFCYALKKYPRGYTMSQLSYFVDIVAHLSGKQGSNGCIDAIGDVSTWWEVEWRDTPRVASNP